MVKRRALAAFYVCDSAIIRKMSAWIMAIIISFLGVGVVAIPTGIISAGFVEQYTELQRAKSTENIKGTVKVEIDGVSPFLNLSIKKAEEQYHITALVIIRKGEVILPKP